jgi:hypothetical protein
MKPHSLPFPLPAGILAALALAGCLGSDTEDPDPLTDIAPVITAQPRDTTVAAGDNALFSVEATGALSYQWVRGTSDTLEGEVLPVLILEDVPESFDGRKYKCVIRNLKGRVVSSSATLHVSGEAFFSPLLDTGYALYQGYCTGCHGIEGRGSPGGVPPHANSDWFMNNKRKTIEAILKGYNDSIFVNGMPYYGEMPAYGSTFSNLEVAAILTYLRIVLNDSTVTSCTVYNQNDPSTYDDNGFPHCQKVARTYAQRAADSVRVSEVKAVRDSLGL